MQAITEALWTQVLVPGAAHDLGDPEISTSTCDSDKIEAPIRGNPLRPGREAPLFVVLGTSRWGRRFRRDVALDEATAS